MRRFAIAGLAILLLAAASPGGDTIAFKTVDEKGEVLTGRVKEIQKDGVLLEMESATAVVAWERIHPADRYRLRESVTGEEDASAHLALAEKCIDEAYFEGARRELERALALGHRDGKKIQDLMDIVDIRECEGLNARFEEAVSKQEYQEALETVRLMAMRFPSSRLTAAARARTSSLLNAQRAARIQTEKDARAAAEAEKAAKRDAWLAALFEDATKETGKGKDAMVTARHYDAKGNLTRARKGYEAAERSFLDARRTLLRIRRATRSGPDFDRADNEVRSVEQRLLEAYVRMAKMYADQRNYKRAVMYVDRALLFDPVNPEALRIGDQIRRNRIHRSMRGITNSPGVIVR